MARDNHVRRAVDRFLAGPAPGPPRGVARAVDRFLAVATTPALPLSSEPSSADIDRLLAAALDALTLAVERQVPRGGVPRPTRTPTRTRRQALRALEARHDRENQVLADAMHRRLEAMDPTDTEARVRVMQDRQDQALELGCRHAAERRALRRRYTE
ncbi:MAG: hypothetical protein ACYC61_17795 [Isosphaeraceae bacterium]